MSTLYIKGKLRPKIVNLIKINKIPNVTKALLLLEAATKGDGELVALLLVHFNDKQSWLSTYLGRSIFFKNTVLSILEMHIASSQQERNVWVRNGGKVDIVRGYANYDNNYNPDYNVDAVYKEERSRKQVNWKKRIVMRALSQAVKHTHCDIVTQLLDFGVPLDKLIYQDEIALIIEERRNNDPINGYGESGNLDVYADLFFHSSAMLPADLDARQPDEMLFFLLKNGFNPWQSKQNNIEDACQYNHAIIKPTIHAMLDHEPTSPRTRNFVYQHYKMGTISLKHMRCDTFFTDAALENLVDQDKKHYTP